MDLDAAQALDAAMRGLEALVERERYSKDSPTLPGLDVACTYLRGQVDLLRAQQDRAIVDRALPAPGPQGAPEAPDDGITDTQQTATGTFEPVTEPVTTGAANRSRRDK